MSQGKASDLNRVGGNTTLTGTVGPNTKVQLDAVALNSGIIVPGGVSTVNNGPVKENRYTTHDSLADGGGNAKTKSYEDSSYTTS